MERLHPPVEHLGEAGDRRDVRDREPGLAQGARRPAGGDQLEPERDEPATKVLEAGLVAHGEERPTRSRERVRGARRVQDDVSAANRERAGREERDGSRQEAVLHRPDPLVNGHFVVAGEDRDGFLGEDRPSVERRVDDVDRAARDRDAVRQRISDRVRARERREQRRVGVEDPPADGGDGRGGPRSACIRRARRGRSGRPRASLRRSRPSRPGTRAVSIPCSAAQSRAGQARSAKTRTRSAPSSSPAGGGPEGAEVAPGPRDTHGESRRPPRGHAGRLHVPRAELGGDPTVPMTTASGRAAEAVSRAPGATTSTIPIPPLNVARSSASSIPPSPPSRRITEGIGQRPRVHPRPEARRQGTRDVAGQAAAGDVGDPPDVVTGGHERRPRGEDPPGIDPRRREEDVPDRRELVARLRGEGRVAGGVAERPGELLLVRPVERDLPLSRGAPGPARIRWRAARTTAGPG